MLFKKSIMEALNETPARAGKGRRLVFFGQYIFFFEILLRGGRLLMAVAVEFAFWIAALVHGCVSARWAICKRLAVASAGVSTIHQYSRCRRAGASSVGSSDFWCFSG